MTESSVGVCVQKQPFPPRMPAVRARGEAESPAWLGTKGEHRPGSHLRSFPVAVGSLPSDALFLPRHQIPKVATVGPKLFTQVHQSAPSKEKGGRVL